MRRIVYYLGAGLTKSLELPQGPVVPLMWDFVQVMAEYVEDDVILTTLVQLELAEVYEHQSPVLKDLAATLDSDSGRSPENRARFGELIKRRPKESIEDLLARSLEKPADWTASGCRTRFRYGINRLFFHIDWRLDWAPLCRFLRNQLSMPNATHTIVSFNYDIVLEHELEDLTPSPGFKVAWHPSTGYGFPNLQYFAMNADARTQEDRPGHGSIPHKAIRFRTPEPSAVRVLKPHGSLNWLAPYQFVNGHWRFLSEQIVVPVTSSCRLQYTHSTATFQPVDFPLGNRRRAPSVEPLIVPPTKDKSTNVELLQQIEDQADVALQHATDVYVIGWSMPVTDRDQVERVVLNVAKRQEPIQRLTIINKQMPDGDIERVRLAYGVDRDRTEVYNDGFADYAGRLATVGS